MIRSIGHHIGNALESLRAARLRTAMATVGVTIGIAGVTVMLALMQGASTLFGSYIPPHTGDTVAFVRSGAAPATATLLTDNLSYNLSIVNTLTERDVQTISKIAHGAAAPLARFHATLRSTSAAAAPETAAIIGTTAGLQEIASLTLSEGQFVGGADGVVVGRQLAIDLFGTEHAIGQVLRIHGEPLPVIGVLQPQSRLHHLLQIDFNMAVLMSLSTSRQFTHGTSQIQQIVMTSPTAEALSQRITAVQTALDTAHHGERDYHIVTGADIAAPASQLLNTISITVAMIAGISLLVGGMGVMNIMLANVAERQREIGIRRAVGATNGHIIGQFLVESIIIGLIGGTIGYGLGLGSTYLLSLYLPFTPVIAWQPAAIAIGISLIVGIIFGLYPAARATQKTPVEMLRF